MQYDFEEISEIPKTSRGGTSFSHFGFAERRKKHFILMKDCHLADLMYPFSNNSDIIFTILMLYI